MYFFLFCFPHSYALPTKCTEVMLMQEQGTKMYTDAILKTHQRVVQVSPAHLFLHHTKSLWEFIKMYICKHFHLFVQLSSPDASLCSVLIEVLLKSQPEGVQLSVNEVSICI